MFLLRHLCSRATDLALPEIIHYRYPLCLQVQKQSLISLQGKPPLPNRPTRRVRKPAKIRARTLEWPLPLFQTLLPLQLPLLRVSKTMFSPCLVVGPRKTRKRKKMPKTKTVPARQKHRKMPVRKMTKYAYSATYSCEVADDYLGSTSRIRRRSL